MALSFTNQGTSANPDINDDVDRSSYTNTSWTPPSSGLIVAFVFNRKTATPDTPTMSGNSLTWTNIVTVQGVTDANNRATLFGANASGSTTGATTVDFGGVTQLGCFVSFFHVAGVDLSGGVAAAFVQSPTGQGAGTSASITLAAAGHADNRPISFFGHITNEVVTPRTNWTELDEFLGTAPLRGINSQYRGDTFETTASASWATSAPWVGIAAEIKATVGGAPVSTRRALLGVGI